VGLNLTRIGVDPALYSALSPCQPLFSDIFFKSRSSNSFTADMKDFVTPMVFTQNPVMDYSLRGDTIRCNHLAATITLTNNSTFGYYTWQPLSGAIAGSNSDSSQLSINKPGEYIVSASPAQGCPPTRVDTIIVPIDTFPPVASAFSGLSGNMLALYGGNAIASNYPTPFGGSQGLTYNWSGPDAFSSTLQNPLTDTVWGKYLLTVTEKRNGCTDTASATVSANMFIALLSNNLFLSGSSGPGGVSLHWQDVNAAAVSSYVVERMNETSVFQQIGTVVSSGCLCYLDAHPLAGEGFYRIKAVAMSGPSYYSVVISVGVESGDNYYFAGGPAGMNLVADVSKDGQGVLVVYDLKGQTLQKRNVWLSQGGNTIALPAKSAGVPTVQVVGLFVKGRLVFSGKSSF
jgi:hypothetical protein